MSKLYHGRSIPPSLSVEDILINPPNYEVSFYENVSPEMANKLLSHYHFDKQRSCSQAQVNKLAKAILKKEFRPVSPLTFAINDSLAIVCVNGQHTLKAIVQANKTTKLLISFSPDTAKDIYTVIDNHRRRTVLDSVRAIGNWGDNLQAGELKAFGAACKILSSFNLRQRMIDPYKVNSTMEFYLDSFLQYKDTVQGIGTPEIASRFRARPPTVVGVALLKHSRKSNIDKIRLFFYRIVSGDSKPKTPERWLYNKYFLGRKKSWGFSLDLEVKDLLTAWYLSCNDMKQPRNYKDEKKTMQFKVWGMDYNLWDTSVKFTSYYEK